MWKKRGEVDGGQDMEYDISGGGVDGGAMSRRGGIMRRGMRGEKERRVRVEYGW